MFNFVNKWLSDEARFAKWSKIELTFRGPASLGGGEPNPFAVKLDVDFCSPDAWILYGDGQGKFQVQQLSVGIGNHESRVAGVNGDGRLDIVTKPHTWDSPRVDVWLKSNDPTQPNEDFFLNVDYVVDKAESLGLYIGMLPTWGDHVSPLKGKESRRLFTPQNAASYGEFLGRRYRDKPIVWILGGDHNPTPEEVRTWRAMAAPTDNQPGITP